MTCPLSPARVLHEIDSRRREALLALHPILLPAACNADWNRRVVLSEAVAGLRHIHPLAPQEA